jgi:hypothetical protein
MIQVNEAHSKIMSILERRGPSVPMQLANEMHLNSLFISAFLSEMVDGGKIRVSNLKVGGSPLYFIDRHEPQLERFYTYLAPKEAEAFLLLKKNKVLKDRDQEPAIRVALRSIKDFSFSLSFDEELYWRYYLVPELEARTLLTAMKTPPVIEKKEEPQAPEMRKEIVIQIPVQEKIVEKEPVKTKAKKTSKKPEDEMFENPLVIKREVVKKEKAKSAFVLKVIEFVNKHSIKLVEEKEHKAKEYLCIVEINSELGPLNFYTCAKDKKIISEDDVKKLLSDAQKIPLPAFILYTGEMSGKAKEYLKKYSSILKAKKIG